MPRSKAPRASSCAYTSPAGAASIERDDVQSSRAPWRLRTGASCISARATRNPASNRDRRRLNPQRLDTLVGKILRIVPDLREHTTTTTVSENGRYRIPNDNPFVSIEGARKEIWALRLAQSPSRLSLVMLTRRGLAHGTLLAFNIGLVSWETVVVIKKGANYGYPLREGTQTMSATNGMGPLLADDMIPVQISDTVTRGTVKPTYPVAQYPHCARRRRRDCQRLRVSRKTPSGFAGNPGVR